MVVCYGRKEKERKEWKEYKSGEKSNLGALAMETECVLMCFLFLRVNTMTRSDSGKTGVIGHIFSQCCP